MCSGQVRGVASKPMVLRESFSLRQKPRGLVKWILQVPVWQFSAGLGFLFGDRFIVVVHRGRRSGRIRWTALEVVVHDRGEYFVCSGTGARADWYLNLRTEPALEVWAGVRRWQPRQRFLSEVEGERVFAGYEDRHSKTAERVLGMMGNSYDGTDAGRLAMMADMPMVGFTDS